MGTISRTLRIRPEESTLVAAMVSLCFIGMTGLVAGQSAISALFFERVGTDALPVMYLLQGSAAFAVMLVLTGVLGRVQRRIVYLSIPVGLAGLVIVERVALLTDVRWIYAVLWLTVVVAILVQNVFVWGIAGAVTDTRRAKRLFPLFAAGEILGSVAGGLITGPLVRLIGTENVLLAWAVALAVGFALARTVLASSTEGAGSRRSGRRPTAWRDMKVAFGYVRRSRLLVWMTFSAILSSVLYFSLYLPFATAATVRFPGAGDLARFFGLFHAVMTAAAFLVSVFATNRLFARFGLAPMSMVLPLLYAGSFGILLVSSALVTLVALRFVDGVWLQGVASPAWETLTNVIPDARRDQVRAFMNGGPAQAGTVIAGVIALVGQDVLSPRQFAAIGLVAALLAVFVAWRVRRSYASALVEALRAGRPPVFTQVAVAGVPFAFGHDAQALGSALDAARDDRPHVRRLAVQLLAGVDDVEARASVVHALRDEDPTVREQAIAALDPAVEGDRLIERLLPLIDDADAAVAARAAASLVGRTSDRRPEARLRALASDEDERVRALAFEHLGIAPPAFAAPLASTALNDPTPGVRAAALSALARADPERALEDAVRLLEDTSPRVRDAAAEAIARAGEPAVGAALAALERPAARAAALSALMRHDLSRHGTAVRAFATERIGEASTDHELAAAIPGDGRAERLLREALEDRARRNGVCALRALALISDDGTTMHAAIESLDASDPAQIANALEALEAAAGSPHIRPLLSIWEPADPARAADARDWAEQVMHDEDAFITACGELALASREGGDVMVRDREAMPVMERVLFLRDVPLFEALAPVDLYAIAEVADEHVFADGELLAAEGEIGDEMHIVVSGTVRVESNGEDIARRGPGDVVGEMSLITHDPRVASLVADGDVRAIRIGRREFESMVHDRPGIAIGVMRVLARRLAERPFTATHH